MNVDVDSNFMEHKEIQNILDPELLFDVNESGLDFGRGEREPEAVAISDNTEAKENGAIDFEDGAEQKIVANIPSPRPTAFTKVEKSLASLGFFTPSSRR